MNKRSINDNPILHLVLGIFLLFDTLIFFVGIFTPGGGIVFSILTLVNAYLCYFHFEYSHRMKMQNPATEDNLNTKTELGKDREDESNYTNRSSDDNHIHQYAKEEAEYFDTYRDKNNIMSAVESNTENKKTEEINSDFNNTSLPNSSDINDFFK